MTDTTKQQLQDGERGVCAFCGGTIYWAKRARRWLHEATPWNPPHPAAPAERAADKV